MRLAPREKKSQVSNPCITSLRSATEEDEVKRGFTPGFPPPASQNVLNQAPKPNLRRKAELRASRSGLRCLSSGTGLVQPVGGRAQLFQSEPGAQPPWAEQGPSPSPPRKSASSAGQTRSPCPRKETQEMLHSHNIPTGH